MATPPARPEIGRISLQDWLEVQKTKLLVRFPFYGLLLTYLKLVPSEQVPVAATDGVHLYYNPAFWEREILARDNALTAQGLLLHETLHPALGHLWRIGSRDPRKWNAGCDFIINLIVTDLGLQIPAGGLLDPQYRGMTEEEVYARLPDRETLDIPGWLMDLLGPSHPGQRVDGEPVGGSLEEAWRARLVCAGHAVKSRGLLPASIERLLDRLLAPRHDLRSALHQFVTPFPADYDWRTPERRYLATYGLYLPRLSGDQIQRLVIDIDLSGSIDPGQMAKFFSILREILGLYDRVEATVMTSDATVHDVWELSNDSPLPTSGRGGGGTAMEPVFEKIEELRLDPYGVLILTDGYASYPNTPPPYPVLWILTPQHEIPPWGQILILDEE